MTTDDQKQQQQQQQQQQYYPSKDYGDQNKTKTDKSSNNNSTFKPENHAESVSYWKKRYEILEEDYTDIHNKNQILEQRLLDVVEAFNAKEKDLLDKVEYEKSTLMADVNKLSNKLVDARIKLHDYEEREMMRQGEVSSKTNVITSRTGNNNHAKDNNQTGQDFDPNVI